MLLAIKKYIFIAKSIYFKAEVGLGREEEGVPRGGKQDFHEQTSLCP